MKTIQKLLSALLIAGTLVGSTLDAARTRGSGQARNYPATKPATVKPAAGKPAAKNKPQTPRKATDNWVDQHAANRLTHVANYLLNIRNSKDPQKRVKLAQHIREIAAALEAENPEKAKELLKAVPKLGGSRNMAQTASKRIAGATARA